MTLSSYCGGGFVGSDIPPLDAALFVIRQVMKDADFQIPKYEFPDTDGLTLMAPVSIELTAANASSRPASPARSAFCTGLDVRFGAPSRRYRGAGALPLSRVKRSFHWIVVSLKMTEAV